MKKETLLKVIQTVDEYFQLHPERKERAHHLGCYVTTYLEDKKVDYERMIQKYCLLADVCSNVIVNAKYLEEKTSVSVSIILACLLVGEFKYFNTMVDDFILA